MLASKNIVFVNYNAGSPYHGPNLRSFYQAKSLLGSCNVRIISSSYSHKYHKEPDVTGVVTEEVIDEIPFYWLKVPKYKSIIMRIICQYIYGFFLIFNSRKLIPKNSILVFSCPPQDLIFFVLVVAYFRKATLVTDVRDIWPLTQIQMSKKHLLNPYTYVLFLAQFLIYKFSVRVVSPLDSLYLQWPKVIGEKFRFIPNTSLPPLTEESDIQLKALYKPPLSVCSFPLDSIDSIENSSCLKIVYSGSFDRDNAFENLVFAAEQIEREDVVFIFMGDGIRKNWLLERVQGSKNIVVLEKLAPNQVIPFLRVCDVGFCGLHGKQIYEYGVSLGKSFEYLRASIPILWMVNSTPVLNEACVSVKVDDIDDLVVNIHKLANQIDEFRSLFDTKVESLFLENYSEEAVRLRLESLFSEVL
ncbi:hypothetical protein ACMXYO_02940 [Neptuniibacter sp. QD37_6]|uniref:hypothetical protein n=1 Tax=Neptuniibacter sp. QD37_6 TaxID=3398210 RepID=UPI0039F48DB8